MERTSFSGVSKNHRFREYILSTLFMRAKAKQAKNAKNRFKSERCRYIYKQNIALDLEWESIIFAFTEYLKENGLVEG